MSRDFSDFERVLDRVLEMGIPGYDCAVCCRHEPVFRRTMGVADTATGAPITRETL